MKMAKRTKALRSTKNGMVFPYNESLALHDDVEHVTIGEDGKVIEPEEVGPAAAMDLPDLSVQEEPEAEEEVETESTRAPRRSRSK
jgi:hypothetical protein